MQTFRELFSILSERKKKLIFYFIKNLFILIFVDRNRDRRRVAGRVQSTNKRGVVPNGCLYIPQLQGHACLYLMSAYTSWVFIPHACLCLMGAYTSVVGSCALHDIQRYATLCGSFLMIQVGLLFYK